MIVLGSTVKSVMLCATALDTEKFIQERKRTFWKQSVMTFEYLTLIYRCTF